MARPLQKTYSPSRPYVVIRCEEEDGSISYEIWDERPDSYHRLCSVHEDEGCTRGRAKRDADLIVRALNEMVPF